MIDNVYQPPGKSIYLSNHKNMILALKPEKYLNSKNGLKSAPGALDKKVMGILSFFGSLPKFVIFRPRTYCENDAKNI